MLTGVAPLVTSFWNLGAGREKIALFENEIVVFRCGFRVYPEGVYPARFST